MIGIMIAMVSAFGQESITAQTEVRIQELEAQKAQAATARCQAIDLFIDIFGSSSEYLQDLQSARQEVRDRYKALGHPERRLIRLLQAPESVRTSALIVHLKQGLTREERQRLLDYHRASTHEDWLTALNDMYYELLRQITYQEFELLSPSAIQRIPPFDHRSPVRCSTDEPSNAHN